MMGSPTADPDPASPLRTSWLHRGNGADLWLRLVVQGGPTPETLVFVPPDAKATVERPLHRRTGGTGDVYDARVAMDEVTGSVEDPAGTWTVRVRTVDGAHLPVPPSDDDSSFRAVLASSTPLTVTTPVHEGAIELEVRRRGPWGEANRIELGDEEVVIHGTVVGRQGPGVGWMVFLRDDAATERTVPLEQTGTGFRLRLAGHGVHSGEWALSIGPEDGARTERLPLARLLDDIERKDETVLFPWHQVASTEGAVELQPAFTRDGEVVVRARGSEAETEPTGDPNEEDTTAVTAIRPRHQRWRRRWRRLKKRGSSLRSRVHPLSVVMRFVFAAVAVLARLSRLRRSRSPDDATRVHLVLLNAYGMGGTIRTVTNLANALGSDASVRLISVVQERDEPFFTTVPDVTRQVLVDRRKDPGRLARAFARRPSLLVPGSEPRSYRFDLRTDLALVRALWSLPPGVLLTTRPALNLLAARYAPGRLTLVGQEHLILSAHRPGLRDEIVRRYPSLDALTVLTEEDEREYREELGGALILRHIPNAVPDIAFPRSDLTAKRVVAAGRFGPVKRFDLLVHAFAKVVEHRPDWSLRLYGSGDTSDEVAQLVRSRGLGEHIQLMGRTEHIWQEMAKGSIFALSSSFEGFGMVLVEAFNCGLPVVSFACPRGPREIVEHEVNGLLVPEEDVDELASGLLRMIDDRELRERCAAGALEHGRRYSMEAVAPRWRQLFADAVASGTP